MSEKHEENTRLSAHATAAQLDLPKTITDPTLLVYRSSGIGLFGVLMRFSGMPLEKIALFMNSSQVSGKGQFAQAVRLTFKDGALGPYKVVGAASMTAWFLQYSVMGFAFQFVDQTLSRMFGVKPTYYGKELMEPANVGVEDDVSLNCRLRSSAKTMLAPILAATLETKVSNRAEVQRFFGRQQFATIESNLLARTNYPALSRIAGPAFFPGCMRNIVMCQTSFILTPITYKLYFPQERKSNTTLFWCKLIIIGTYLCIVMHCVRS